MNVDLKKENRMYGWRRFFVKMKLIIGLLGLAAVAFSAWLGYAQNTKPPEQLPIKIDVGPGKNVRVTIPNFARVDLVKIISTLLSNGDEEAKTNFNAVIGKASAVTLVLTTELP